jgi:hypothetical protein
MSFTSIPSAIIAAGQAIKQELLSFIKDGLDDHESRLSVVEGSSGRLPPISFDVVGSLNSPLTMTGALIYRVEANLTVTAARLLVKTAGSSGSVAVDVEYSRNNGSTWTSILSAPISAANTLGNYALVSGTLVFQNFLAGDLIRLDINSVQNNMQDFNVYLENESA